MLDRVEDLLIRQANVDRLQDRAHHGNGEERLQEPVRVPVEHPDGVAGPHAERRKAAREPVDSLLQRAIGEPLLVAIDDLLIRRMQHRGVQQMLDQQRIGICRWRDVDETAGQSLPLSCFSLRRSRRPGVSPMASSSR